MRRTISFLALLSALVIGVSLFATPSTSHATTVAINNLTVTVGGIQWCISGCTNPIWGAAAGTSLTSSDVAGPTKVLILTQTSGFNFDSSERGSPGPNQGVPCDTTNPCTTTLNINGTNIVLSGTQLNALANFNSDSAGAHAEASNWNGFVFDGGNGGLRVWFGYADTAHSDACADTTGTVPGNCLPDNPWQGSANTSFIGAPVTGGPSAGCVHTGFTSCFDAGAIRIEVNPTVTGPEPSTMLLLGVGLVGLAAWGKKRQRDSRK